MSGKKAARPRIAIKLRAGYRPNCCGPKIPNEGEVGSQSYHSSLWTLILQSQCHTQYSMETAYQSTQGNCSRSEHYQCCTPQLDPAVLVLGQGTSSVRSEEPQPPFMSDVEETPTISRDENSSLNSPHSSPNKIMISSSATSPP